MKTLAIFVVATVLAINAANAGNNNRYSRYVEEQTKIEALIETKKAKLSQAETSKFLSQMTKIRRELYEGESRMDRAIFYSKADDAMEVLKTIRKSVEAK